MKKYRIISLFIAASIPFSMYGCAGNIGGGLKPARSSSEKSESKAARSAFYDKYSPVELDTIKERISLSFRMTLEFPEIL